MNKMPEGSTSHGGYDVDFFRKQGFYDGYVIGKKKPRHSQGSWQSYHYEEGFRVGQLKRTEEETKYSKK